MASIETRSNKKKSMRDDARGPRAKWARMEHAIGEIPEETATKVVEKMNVALKEQVDGVISHITSELDARFGHRPSEEESANVTIARLKLQMETVKNKAVQDKEKKKTAAAAEKEAAAAAKKEAAAAAKKEAAAAKKEAAAAKRRVRPNTGAGATIAANPTNL